MYFDFSILAYVPSTNMEEAGFLTFTATSHQRAVKRCCHSSGAVLSSTLYTDYGGYRAIKNMTG